MQMRRRIGVLESVIYLKHKHYRSSRSVKSLHCLPNVCFHSVPTRSICGKIYRMLCIIINKTYCSEESWYRFFMRVNSISLPKKSNWIYMRQKEEMPSFNHNSCGISLLFILLAIYMWHRMEKK